MARVPWSGSRIAPQLAAVGSRIRSEATQLGLRFAAAKLPSLRTDGETGNLVEPKRGLGGQMNRSWSRRSPVTNR
jgi:hypothetical protein